MGARTDEGGHTSQITSLGERDAKVVVSAIEGIDEGRREGSLCIGVCNSVLSSMSEGMSGSRGKARTCTRARMPDSGRAREGHKRVWMRIMSPESTWKAIRVGAQDCPLHHISDPA
jgi:hypothetical protein